MSLGILCPGQGAQHPAMLDLVRGEPEAERVLALASAVLEAPVADILSGPAEALFANAMAQPSDLCGRAGDLGRSILAAAEPACVRRL